MNTDNLNLFADIALASNTPKANVERVTDKKYARIQLVAPFLSSWFYIDRSDQRRLSSEHD